MMTKQTIQTLRDDVNAALAEVARKHGVAIHAGNCTYDTNAATFKLVCSTLSDDGIAMTPEASLYDNLAKQFGWVPLFSTVSIGVDEYRVVGYNSRARKTPVIVERNGKRFKVGESFVIRKPELVG